MIPTRVSGRLLAAAQLAGPILLLLACGACTQSPQHHTTPSLGEPSIQSDRTVVTIEGGKIEGTVSRKVLFFKGVPFAAPPIGNRRWRAPQPVTPWAGVRKTTTFGHDCMQAIETNAAVTAASSPSEDCLALNVWRGSDCRSSSGSMGAPT